MHRIPRYGLQYVRSRRATVDVGGLAGEYKKACVGSLQGPTLKVNVPGATNCGSCAAFPAQIRRREAERREHATAGRDKPRHKSGTRTKKETT